MRSLIGASLAVVLVLPVAASVPEAPAEDARSFLPAACNQFGLTPRAADRERRETERRELRQRDAIRTAHELRAHAGPALDPHTPGAAVPATRISAAELIRLSAGTGRVVTAEVIEANQQLNERSYSFYDPEGRLIAETEWSTAARPANEWEYVWFGDVPLAQIDLRTGSIAYYFTDHLETPILQTDEQGRVIWRAEHDPYGSIFAIRVGEDRHQPLRFAGQLADLGDHEADLHYNVFRWYRPAWGRYTQADPVGLEGGMNVYRYGAANPLTYIDPLGLKICRCDRRLAFNAFAFGQWFYPAVAFGAYHSFIQILPDERSCGGYDGLAWGFQDQGGGIGRVEPERTPSFNPMLRCREVRCIDEDELRSNINADAGGVQPYRAVCRVGAGWNAQNCQGWADRYSSS